jgi:hypothetical protein
VQFNVLQFDENPPNIPPAVYGVTAFEVIVQLLANPPSTRLTNTHPGGLVASINKLELIWSTLKFKTAKLALNIPLASAVFKTVIVCPLPSKITFPPRTLNGAELGFALYPVTVNGPCNL